MSVKGALTSAVQRVAATSGFLRVAPTIVPPIDRVAHRLTGGRALLSTAIVPTIVLSTTGRRTGLARSVPLAAWPEPSGAFLVVGSNFGQQAHPAWSGNLLASPHATVEHRGETFPVVAHLLDDHDRDAVWRHLVVAWPAYASYADRSGRTLRVFRLVRAAGGQGSGQADEPASAPAPGA